MMKPKHLFAIFFAIFILLVSGIEAKNRKGDKLLKAGQAAEAREDWDKALDLYEQAVDTDPGDIAYLVPMRKARFEAGQAHVKAGQKLRTDGKPIFCQRYHIGNIWQPGKDYPALSLWVRQVGSLKPMVQILTGNYRFSQLNISPYTSVMHP